MRIEDGIHSEIDSTAKLRIGDYVTWVGADERQNYGHIKALSPFIDPNFADVERDDTKLTVVVALDKLSKVEKVTQKHLAPVIVHGTAHDDDAGYVDGEEEEPKEAETITEVLFNLSIMVSVDDLIRLLVDHLRDSKVAVADVTLQDVEMR